MKKTLLLALLSASSLALASSKVELSQTLENDNLHSKDVLNFKENLKTSHKLEFVVAEDKFSVSGELKAKGDHAKKLEEAFSFDGGNTKLAYKYNNFDASLKLEFPSIVSEVYGAYTHKKDDVLNAKHSVTVRKGQEELSGKLVSDLSYKYSDKFTLANVAEISGGVNNLGEFVFPQFLVSNKVKGLHLTKVFTNELKGIYTPTEEIKLTPSVSFKYGSESLQRGENVKIDVPKSKEHHKIEVERFKTVTDNETKYVNKTDFKAIEASKTPLDIKVSLKGEYSSKDIAGLKADLSVSGGKKIENLNASAVVASYNVDTKAENTDSSFILNVKTNETSVNVAGGVSYKYELENGFSITPALTGKYDYMKDEYAVFYSEKSILDKIKGIEEGRSKIEEAIQSNKGILSLDTEELKKIVDPIVNKETLLPKLHKGSYTTHNIVVTPKLSAGYKMDKFEVMLGLETPVFISKKVSQHPEFDLKKEREPEIATIKHSLVVSQLFNKEYEDKNNNDKLTYNKTTAKVSLNLKYSW